MCVYFFHDREDLSQWPELTGAGVMDEASGGTLVQETVSDEMLAQLLQLQFDQEYDRALGKEEAKKNGTSKGKVLLLFLFFTNFNYFQKFIQWVFHFPTIARFQREVS